MINETKLFFYGILIWFCCTPQLLPAQTLHHVLGELLVQVKSEEEIQQVVDELQAISIPANIRIKKALHSPAPIFIIGFDHNLLNEFHFLERVRQHNLVQVAQFNHFVDSRVEPNDPFFSLQWHYLNDGSLGGTLNADLDADLAWEITTGGLSATGDTIVICIVDEGFDLNHVDFENNIWRNHQEIPNNGIDDDGNDYIDDYLGWNVKTNTDDILTDPTGIAHGTPVAGIIGAKGNNGIGVAGLNWNVKLMNIVRGDTEAEIIEAYTYPFLQRKRFNQTAGEEGDFIVAVNTSWGLNFGQPSEAPLWCAFYDSLGTQGIVCPAATINSDQNVDLVGDLPTTCPSEFLISMTSIDNNNTKVTNAGYGPIHIDMAAYGKKVATTSPNNSTAFYSGTSLTSPQVSGTIGLMYAACPSLAALAKSNPSLAAIQVKDILLNSGQYNANLEGITSQAAHLNVNQCLEELIANCDFSGCYGPYSIELFDIQTNHVTFNWIADTTSNYVNLRYRVKGNTIWTPVNFINSPYSLDNLLSCTVYEFQLKPVCNNFPGVFTSIGEFKTDGCCTAPNNLIASPSTDASLIEWNPVTAANSYQIDYRLLGAPVWEILNTTNASIILSNLLPCNEYEFRVLSNCDSSVASPYSPILTFKTKDCGLCLDLSYCAASGPVVAGNIWISKVKLGDIDQVSANENGGYSNFTSSSTALIRGYFELLEIETTYEFFEMNSLFKVWIDFNQNGTFEDLTELVFDPIGKSTKKLGVVVIPSTAKLGSTRMRVAVRDEDYGPCGNLGFSGEVEDYCVDIIESTDCLKPGGIMIQSGANSASINWIGGSSSNNYTLRIRQAGTADWQEEMSSSNSIKLTNLLTCAEYELQIRANCQSDVSEFSAPVFFKTIGCGACLDENYCIPTTPNATFEWIQEIKLNTLTNNSGPNLGYVDFALFSSNLVPGNQYTIQVTPGFATQAFQEYFKVWIDFNQDGHFGDTTELIFDPGQASTTAQSGTIDIPIDALEGSTKMRVSMKYLNPQVDACEGGFSGEIEDYCVNISANSSFNCLPAEQANYFYISEDGIEFQWLKIPEVTTYHFRYRLLNGMDDWHLLVSDAPNIQLHQLPQCEEYEYQMRTICNEGISVYSPSYNFFSNCISVNNEVADEMESELQVFPNPFDKNIRILFSNPQENQIGLYDITGKQIQHFEIQAVEQVDLSILPNLTSGVYFLKIQGIEYHEVFRIVKSK